MKNYYKLILLVLFFTSCETSQELKSEICKWQGNKKAAISITYDDGIINQFTVARPIMNNFGFKGTFFVITGKLDDAGKGKFIGRPIEEIIKESASIKTDSSNFFERASAIGFSGQETAIFYHSKAGSLFENGKIKEAHTLLDEAYEKLRNRETINSNEIIFHDNAVDTSTWQDFRNYIAEGHEIASHTVTHPRLAVLDEPNLLYELTQSKVDIERHLGKASTFSAEGPYGTENERVMEYAHKLYPALRNRMPETWLEELNRGSDKYPSSSSKEYVQWQRGPINTADMSKMKSWVDTCITNDNIWLILVFHGIDGIGWEPRTGNELKEYFGYMKEKQSDLWIATFGDVTKYLRERKASSISQKTNQNEIIVNVTTGLNPEVYNVPLTIKTYIPKNWKAITLKEHVLKIETDKIGNFVIFDLPAKSTKVALLKSQNS